MNKSAFYSFIRHKLFAGKMRQGIVDTIEIILKECSSRAIYDSRQIAYILATAYAESYNTANNPEWVPVREGFADTNVEAIEIVSTLYKQGKIKTNYALPNKKKLSYYGRGWVQITHEYNYQKLGALYNLDLVNHPDLALERHVAAILLVDGMKRGWYTGRKLSSYFTDSITDFEGARAIINGKERAELIADHALKFYQGLIQL